MNRLLSALTGLTLILIATSAFATKNSYTFVNNTGSDANDLHVSWGRAVTITDGGSFKKHPTTAKNKTDLANGSVASEGSCTVEVEYDGTDPDIKEWYWTIDGKKIRTEDKKDHTMASMTTGDGLHTYTFTTSSAIYRAFLPEGSRLGDTIMGTVTMEPKGNDSSTLRGTVIAVNGSKSAVAGSGKFNSIIPLILGGSTAAFLLQDSSGKTIGQHTIPVEINPLPISGGPNPITQYGKPLDWPGQFDPSKPITATINGMSVTPIAANSSHVILPPCGTTGINDVNIMQSGNTVASGKTVNVRVSLSTPKTTISSGEQVTLSVLVDVGNGKSMLNNPLSVELVNETPGVVKFSGGSPNIYKHQVDSSELNATGTYQFGVPIVGASLGTFAISCLLSPDSCGAETHEFSIAKLSKGKDEKGWFVDWREDCQKGVCHKRKNHGGAHAYSWSKCGTHDAKEHKDYYTTKEDRDAAYEAVEKDKKVRDAKNGF